MKINVVHSSRPAMKVHRGGLLALTLLLATGEICAAKFIPLGDLPEGEFGSTAMSVSGDGSVVVGSSSSAITSEAFRWTSGTGMVGLGNLPGSYIGSSAYAVSYDGSVVVGNASSGNGEAFRWTSSTGMVGLGNLPGLPSDYRSTAYGVSADGSVVVGLSGDQAYRWTPVGGMQGLGYLPSRLSYLNSQARGVSADGAVVVGDSGDQAFRWTSEEGMVGLGYLGDPELDSSYATAASADGSFVVGTNLSGSGIEAFRWTKATGMVRLGDRLGGLPMGVATSVSADGSVVVGYINTGNSLDALMWDSANGVRSLHVVLGGLGVDLDGWTLEMALGLSADGQTIVGQGISPSGHHEAWLANISPAPEPSTNALMLTGLVLLAVVTGRCQRFFTSKCRTLDNSAVESTNGCACSLRTSSRAPFRSMTLREQPRRHAFRNRNDRPSSEIAGDRRRLPQETIRTNATCRATAQSVTYKKGMKK